MVKRFVIQALATLKADTISLYLKRQQTLVLAYHNVIPDALHHTGLGSQHMRESDFQRQMLWVARTFDIVPLPEVLRERTGTPTRPRIAITFDDAYRGALHCAIPWMAQHGIPATMFVAPGCLGSDGFWWDRLRVDPWSDFPFFFQEMRADQARIMAWARATNLEVHDLNDLFKPVTEAELADSVNQAAGHLLLGPHGWTHQNLASLPPSELDDELRMPLAWLRERHSETTLPILAFPYGLKSPEVCDAAEKLGHAAAFLIDGSWMPRKLRSPFLIPRRNVAGGISSATFRVLLMR